MKQWEPDFGGPITATPEMELTTVEKRRGAGVTVGGVGGCCAGGITVHKAEVRCSSAACAAL